MEKWEDDRNRRNTHNGHKGRALMAYQCMRAIEESSTVTRRGRSFAKVISLLLLELEQELKTRIDLPTNWGE